MKSLKPDTIAYQLGFRPYTNPASHVSLPASTVAARLKKALSSTTYEPCGDVPTQRVSKPEVDALLFYFQNHAVAVATKKLHPLESLGKYLPLFENYNLMLAEQTRRMFFYLVAICTRESRHNKASSNGDSWSTMKNKYGLACYDFHMSIRGKSSETAVDVFCEHPPLMSLGRYTEYLCDSFYKGEYSNGYGGKAWGGIADVLRKFVHGELSAEMMLDTAFTLCHNNGPIFNKGLFYEGYGQEIYKILDVQRSGQIPRLLWEKGASAAKNLRVLQSLSTTLEILSKEDLMGDKEYVDWYQVEAMGSLHKYPSEKDTQKNVHGNSNPFTAPIPKVGFQPIPAADPEPPFQGLEIMPGVYVKQTEVPR